MNAATVAKAIGGHWRGNYGTAACPVCQPERRRDQNALTMSDGNGGRLLAHCKKSGCDFVTIVAALGLRAGNFLPPEPAAVIRHEAVAMAEARRKADQAERLWHEAQPIADTVAERYLRARGITCALPETLRFHPECWHGPTAKPYPAMVAAVQGAGSPAVHRTWLRPDGSGKAAVEPSKAMLGATAGAAVRLSGGPSRLVVAEGIETALSLLCGLLDAPATVWAALSTSGLRGLRLPAQPGRLTIACDGDAPGRAAAHALAGRAHAHGWQVGFLDPGDGQDFNDHLTGNTVAA